MTIPNRILAALTLAVGSISVLACDEDDDVVVVLNDVPYADLDLNGDSFVQVTELNGWFDEWDANTDGELTAVEFPLPDFAAVDSTENGVLSRREFETAVEEWDVDHNGIVEQEEYNDI